MNTESCMFLLAGVSAALFACEGTQSPPAATSGSKSRAHDASAADDNVSAPVRARGTIIEAERWEVVSEADDPFSDRMPEVSCPEEAYMPELLANEQVFSVDTGSCHYITARQSSLRAVDKGELLKARVWHFALNASEAATAHVALHLGDDSVLDETVPIPSAGGLLAVEVEAPQAFAAGTPVFFHLHNHGDNSWAMVELSAGPKP